MGSGSTKEKTQQIAYQRDFLGSCWNSPYGQQEATQFLPSRWMGLSKAVMELHTGNHCFALRTVRFDDDTTEQQKQNSRLVEEARATIAAPGGGGSGGMGLDHNGNRPGSVPFAYGSPTTRITTFPSTYPDDGGFVDDNNSFASLGGGARLRRQLQVQQPSSLSPSPPPPLQPSPTMPRMVKKHASSQGTRSMGLPSPRGSVRDLASLAGGPTAGTGTPGDSEKGSSHGAEKQKKDIVLTKPKTLVNRKKVGETVLQSAVRDTAEQEKALHSDHPYLKEYGLSVFPGVMFRAAPARRRYDRISFVPTPVEVVHNYMSHIRGERSLYDSEAGVGNNGARGLQRQAKRSPLLHGSVNGASGVGGGGGTTTTGAEDEEEEEGLPLTSQTPFGASPLPLLPTPVMRPISGGRSPQGLLGGLQMAASAPAFDPHAPAMGVSLDSAGGGGGGSSTSHTPTPLRSPARQPGQAGAGRLPQRMSLVLDPAAAVAGQLRRTNPLNPANNYPIEDTDVPSVNAVTPPIIVGSISAAELLALPANAEMCLGGWLYVSLQDEQRRLKKCLAGYEEKLKKRAEAATAAASHARQPRSRSAAPVGGRRTRAASVQRGHTASRKQRLTTSALSSTNSPLSQSAANTRQPSLVDFTPSRSQDMTRSPLHINETQPSFGTHPGPGNVSASDTQETRMARSCTVPREVLLAGDDDDGNANVGDAGVRDPHGRGDAAWRQQEQDTKTTEGKKVDGHQTPEESTVEDGEAARNPAGKPLVRQLSDPTFLRGAAATAATKATHRSQMGSSLNRNRHFRMGHFAPPSATHFAHRSDVVEPEVEQTWLPYAYIFIALPMYECSLHASAFHMATQRAKPISLNLENPLSRRAFGVGCVTSVRYGGVMIIECRDRVCRGDEDWVLHLMALGKERAKMDAAAAAAALHRAAKGPSRDRESSDEDDEVDNPDPKDDSLPIRSGWSLLLDPSQFLHTFQHKQRAEHVQTIKRRIRRRLKRLGLYVVSASTRSAVRQRRAARRSVQQELAAGLGGWGGTRPTQSADDVGISGDDMDDDEEADKNRDGNSDDQDEDRAIQGELDKATKQRKGRRFGGKGRSASTGGSIGAGSASGSHRGGGSAGGGHVATSESDSDDDLDGADAASDYSVGGAHRRSNLDRAFRRQKPQRIIRGTFRQLGGMCYLDAGALMEGCPVSELVRGVELWIHNLLHVPVKARPLSLFLQRYEGIASVLRMAGSHLVSNATDTSGAVLLNNMSFTGNGVTNASMVGGSSFGPSGVAGGAGGGGGGLLLAAGPSSSSPLAGAPSSAALALGHDTASVGLHGPSSPHSPTFGNRPTSLQNGSLPGAIGNSSFAAGSAVGTSLGAGAGGSGAGSAGGMALRLTLPYVTWYAGPLNPNVTAVLPPQLEALIRKETSATPLPVPAATTDPLALSKSGSLLTTVGPKTLAVATLHAPSVTKAADRQARGGLPAVSGAGTAASSSNAVDLASDFTAPGDEQPPSDRGPLDLHDPQDDTHGKHHVTPATADRGVSMPSVRSPVPAGAPLGSPALHPDQGPTLSSVVDEVVSALDAEAVMGEQAEDIAKAAEAAVTHASATNTSLVKSPGSAGVQASLQEIALPGAHTHAPSNESVSTPPPKQPLLAVLNTGVLPGGSAALALPDRKAAGSGPSETIENILMRHGIGGGADADGDALETAAAALLSNDSLTRHSGNPSLAGLGKAHATRPPSPSAAAARGDGDTGGTSKSPGVDSLVGKEKERAGRASAAATAAAALSEESGGHPRHDNPLSQDLEDEDEEEAWLAADRALRQAKGELDELQFLLANAKTELQERLEEYITVGSLFMPHTRSDQIELNVLFLKMLRHYPEEVPIKELRADWLPTMLALLTTPHEDIFARTAVGAMAPHLANAMDVAADACDANRRRESFAGNGTTENGGQDLVTRYTIESFPPTPQILRTVHGLPPLARLREMAIAPLPYRVNPETARALEQMGMDSGLSFVFTGGSLGVLAGALTFYTDHVKRTFKEELHRVRTGAPRFAGLDGAPGGTRDGTGSYAPTTKVLMHEASIISTAAASAKSALELLEQTHTVLLQRLVIWGATTGKKGIKSLGEWEAMHAAYCHMLDPANKSNETASSVNTPGYFLRKFAAAATGRGGDDQEIAAATAALMGRANNPSSATRARLIAKEMDLHAERVGIPFRAAECFALFDAIAYYLTTLETLEQQFSGESQPQKPRKRRSLLKPFMRRGDPAGNTESALNRSTLSADASAADSRTTGREADRGNGDGLSDSHPLLREPFEITIASNYYYKSMLDVRPQPQIVPSSLLPRNPKVKQQQEREQAQKRAAARWPPPRHPETDAISISSGGGGGAGGGPLHNAVGEDAVISRREGSSLSVNDVIVDPTAGSGAGSGAEQPYDTPLSRSRRPARSSVPPTPCITPVRALAKGEKHAQRPPAARSEAAADEPQDDPVGWRRLIGLGSRSSHGGHGGKGKHKHLRKGGDGVLGGSAHPTEPPKGNAKIAGCEVPYCGGEEEMPEGDIYAKLHKDSKKLYKFLEDCLDKWRKQTESGGGSAAAYAKRIRITHE